MVKIDFSLHNDYEVETYFQGKKLDGVIGNYLSMHAYVWVKSYNKYGFLIPSGKPLATQRQMEWYLHHSCVEGLKYRFFPDEKHLEGELDSTGLRLFTEHVIYIPRVYITEDGCTDNGSDYKVDGDDNIKTLAAILRANLKEIPVISTNNKTVYKWILGMATDKELKKYVDNPTFRYLMEHTIKTIVILEK